MNYKFEKNFPEGGFVRVAGSAGFCFGVRRATECVRRAIEEKKPGDKLFTLGKLIHNDTYLARLAARGVEVISEADIPTAAATSDTCGGETTVFIRAHGITRETEEMLAGAAMVHPHFHYVDCTCPYVRKIHRIAAENSGEGREFILIGSADHPEVRGIMSYFTGRSTRVRPQMNSLLPLIIKKW